MRIIFLTLFQPCSRILELQLSSPVSTLRQSDAIDPHLKKPVVDRAKVFSFNLLYDESNERGDSVKVLTVFVRVFEPQNGKIITRYLDTIGITDLTACGIYSCLKAILLKYHLSFAKLLSFTSDTCNVMKGSKNRVIAKLHIMQPKVIDVHCICHVVDLCVKSAAKELPMKVDDLLVDMYYLFHHSVKHVASLVEYAKFCTVEYRSVVKHCQTRWLSLGHTIKRTLQIWDPLCSYFISHSDNERAEKVRVISTILKDPLTKPWLLFLSYVLPVFEKFNVFFQTSSAATIHKVLGESERLLKTVLSFFTDPNIIRINSCDLTKIDYANASNHLPDDHVYIGDDTAVLVLHLKENEVESVQKFFEGVLKFYECFVNKQLKVFDFKSQTSKSKEGI